MEPSRENRLRGKEVSAAVCKKVSAAVCLSAFAGRGGGAARVRLVTKLLLLTDHNKQ